MTTVTRSVNDPVFNTFKAQFYEMDESLTGRCVASSTKDEDFQESIHNEIDALFKEIEKKATFVVDNENYYHGPGNSASVNEERIRLLSRKYIRDLSKEEYARLEILCEKVRQLFPRATSDDFKKFEILGNELESLKKETQRIKEKFNLG